MSEQSQLAGELTFRAADGRIAPIDGVTIEPGPGRTWALPAHA